ncbi:CRISPR-associated endonuclease Cas2 [Chloroflexus sp.]|uniref:CRISPR-associated endonuclease Cas2 n=1 Tax=Chloroflexus sp. TaxID=1904827 RepID=UPI002ACE9879|nr:CRISPR-associated endonuclease Cas2 [Chloroflexus sp.]
MQRSEPNLYVVAYDIPNDRRRTKIHNLLSGYGLWTQYSLFECWLTRQQLIELQAKLARYIDAETDSVRFYAICGACQNKVITVGSPKPAPAITYIA